MIYWADLHIQVNYVLYRARAQVVEYMIRSHDHYNNHILLQLVGVVTCMHYSHSFTII